MSVEVRTHQINHKLFVQRIHWISGAGGAFANTDIDHPINGKILCVDTVPGAVATGGVVPANGYDIELLAADSGALDIMGTSLIDRSNVNPERVLAMLGAFPYNPIVRQGITLRIQNIVNACLLYTSPSPRDRS